MIQVLDPSKHPDLVKRFKVDPDLHALTFESSAGAHRPASVDRLVSAGKPLFRVQDGKFDTDEAGTQWRMAVRSSQQEVC